MTRSKKPTVNQLDERLNQLEAALGEVQYVLNLVGASARNDIMRHEEILKALCENADVEFVAHPEPEEKVEESQGECE